VVDYRQRPNTLKLSSDGLAEYQYFVLLKSNIENMVGNGVGHSLSHTDRHNVEKPYGARTPMVCYIQFGSFFKDGKRLVVTTRQLRILSHILVGLFPAFIFP
jgi:hypothetical protein